MFPCDVLTWLLDACLEFKLLQNFSTVSLLTEKQNNKKQSNAFNKDNNGGIARKITNITQ